MEPQGRGQLPVDAFSDPLLALEFLRDLSLKVTEDSLREMPILLYILNHESSVVVGQTIATGTSFYCAVMGEIALQLRTSDTVEKWLEEIWEWMVKFKNAIYGIMSKRGFVGEKLLAAKFLEICILLFTPNVNASELSCKEVNGQDIEPLCFLGSHPVLNFSCLVLDAKRMLDRLLNVLQSADIHSGAVIIGVINCLAVISKYRPIHRSCILSAFLAFNTNVENLKAAHARSIFYSLRTAFLDFLRKRSNQITEESRGRLLSALQAMDLGERTRNMVLQVEKMDDRKLSSSDTGLTQKAIAKISALMAEGEAGVVPLEAFVSSIQPDLLADIVIANMKNLPK